MRKIRRGDIFYVREDHRRPEVGSEQRKGRPAVVVSNNAANKFSTVVEVVYLTTQKKTPLPTHVRLNGKRIQSTALCEQVHSVSTDLFGNYFGRCGDDDMKKIDHALGISLGLVPGWREVADGER